MKELYATALRCGRPGCMQALYRVSDTGARVLNSRVAHIHARRENGPRWNAAMTGEENRGYDNLIVLCLEDASEIDITPERFPADTLRERKSSTCPTCRYSSSRRRSSSASSSGPPGTIAPI